MARFRSKPVEIEAIFFDGTNEAEVSDFAETTNFHALDPEDMNEDPEIIASVWDKLHSTWVGVKINQWIIRGTKGEYYPCDADVFAQKYEEVVEVRQAVRPMQVSDSPWESSATAIKRGADWISESSGTITSNKTIHKYPEHRK